MPARKQYARAKIDELPPIRIFFLRITPFISPFGRSHARFIHKDTREIASVGKAALLGDLLYRHLGLLGHETFGFLDTQAVDPLVERAAVLGVDKST